MTVPVRGDGHVFLCYAREDSARVDDLQRVFQDAGLRVWRDTSDLWPGQDWRRHVRCAISDGALAFVACFSSCGLARPERFQYEELVLASELAHRRLADDSWLIPVRFDDCTIPFFDLGNGRSIADLHFADLFGPAVEASTARLISAIQRIVNIEPSLGGSALGAGIDSKGYQVTERKPQGSPTIRRRRLGAELREIRNSGASSRDAVAAALGWSRSKIGRYERGEPGVQPPEVERLLDYYGIIGTRRQFLLALAKDAAQKAWWEESELGISDDYRRYIGAEHEASSIAAWHVEVIPGLLQTAPYARHIIRSYNQVEPIAPRIVERLVKIRMRRQHVLDHEPQPTLSVLLDESVLRRQVGEKEVMYEQLQRLVREADRPNVTLKVLPLSADHSVFSESFVIFSFGPDDEATAQDVVSADHLRTNFSVEGEQESYLHRIAFQLLADAALEPASSRALILQIAESRWSGI